jgi:hypothetical protein
MIILTEEFHLNKCLADKEVGNAFMNINFWNIIMETVITYI